MIAGASSLSCHVTGCSHGKKKTQTCEFRFCTLCYCCYHRCTGQSFRLRILWLPLCHFFMKIILFFSSYSYPMVWNRIWILILSLSVYWVAYFGLRFNFWNHTNTHMQSNAQHKHSRTTPTSHKMELRVEHRGEKLNPEMFANKLTHKNTYTQKTISNTHTCANLQTLNSLCEQNGRFKE